MWAVLVVVRGVLVEDGGEVSFAGDEYPVEAFASGGADLAFGVGVGARRAWRRCDDVDAGGGEHRLEAGGGCVGVPGSGCPRPGAVPVAGSAGRWVAARIGGVGMSSGGRSTRGASAAASPG